MKWLMIIVQILTDVSVQTSVHTAKNIYKIGEEHVFKQLTKAIWEEGKWDVPQKAFDYSEKTIIKSRTLKRTGRKYFIKAIPILSVAGGIFFAGQRIYGKEPWYMTCCELASGVVGAIPGAGIMASYVLDAGMIIRDTKENLRIKKHKKLQDVLIFNKD